MKTFLKILRWLFAIPLIVLLIVITTIGIPATTLSTTITDKEQVKSWLSESGLYKNFANAAIDTLLISASKDEGGGANLVELKTLLNDPNSEVGALFSKIANPLKVESHVNTIIDAGYEWFEGKTAKPTFSIVIADDKETLAQLLSVGFKEKIKALPECDSTFVISEDFNPIEADCRPVGFDVNSVDDFLVQNIDNEVLQLLTDRATFSSDTLNIDPQATQRVQTIYKYISIVPFIFIAVVILLSILLVLIIPGFKNSFTDTGIFIFMISILWIIFTVFGFTYFDDLEKLIFTRVPQQEMITTYNTYFQLTAKNIYSDILWRNIIVSLIVMAYGALLVGIGFVIKKKQKSQSVED